VGYRDQGVALTELIAHLIEERARIDEQLFGAERQLRELTASKNKPDRWRRIPFGTIAIGVMLVGIMAVLHSDAHQGVDELESATGLYTVETNKGCPALDDMVAAGALEEGQNITDPWGTPYLIRCEGIDTFITSAGPDAVHGTPDDI